MHIQIALAPDLPISNQELIDNWNGQPQSSQLASASQQLSKSPLEAFPIDPQQALIFLGGIAGGVALDVIKETLKEQVSDLLKRLDAKRTPRIHVETVRQPDGAVLLVVHEE